MGGYTGYNYPGFSPYSGYGMPWNGIFGPRASHQQNYGGSVKTPGYEYSFWMGPWGMNTYYSFGANPFQQGGGSANPYSRSSGTRYSNRSNNSNQQSNQPAETSQAQASSDSGGTKSTESTKETDKKAADTKKADKKDGAKKKEDDKAVKGWYKEKSVKNFKKFIDSNSNGLAKAKLKKQKIFLGPKRKSKRALMKYAKKLHKFFSKPENQKKFMELAKALPGGVKLVLGPQKLEIDPAITSFDEIYQYMENWFPKNKEAPELDPLKYDPAFRYFTQGIAGNGKSIDKPKVSIELTGIGYKAVISYDKEMLAKLDEKKDKDKIAKIYGSIRWFAKQDKDFVFVVNGTEFTYQNLKPDKFIEALKSAKSATTESVKPVSEKEAKKDSGSTSSDPDIDKKERATAQVKIEKESMMEHVDKLMAILDSDNKEDDTALIEKGIAIIKYWKMKNIPDVKIEDHLKYFIKDNKMSLADAKKEMDGWADTIKIIKSAEKLQGDVDTALAAIEGQSMTHPLVLKLSEAEKIFKKIIMPSEDAKIPLDPILVNRLLKLQKRQEKISKRLKALAAEFKKQSETPEKKTAEPEPKPKPEKPKKKKLARS